MNTTKLLITVIFIGLLATSSYFLFSSSESTPEVIANEGPSQDFIEVTRTPSVPCRPLTFTDKHLSVDIQGMNNCSLPVSSTFDVNWKIEQKQQDFITLLPPLSVEMMVNLPNNYVPQATVELSASSRNLQVFVEDTLLTEIPANGRQT